MEGDVVLDTSVVIKWFRQGEMLAGPSLALRDAYLDGQIAVSAPSLLAYELANVLRYKDDLTPDQVQEAVQSLFDMGLELIPPLSSVMRRAVEIAHACDTTVYDATFAALAESLNATFITADEKLVRKLGALPGVRFLGDIDSE
jgi:predicted nucleic acid-binding protein